jgi:Tfp pilus assembly protein PilN
MNPQGTGINLASQPFARERAEIAVLASICTLLTISLLTFLGLFLAQRGRASALRTSIKNEQKLLDTLNRQQNHFQGVIARPTNADVFSKSVFYNELIARRAVSWTRAFEDLERVMPPDIQLVSLRLPQVVASNQGDKNHIELNLLVGTQQPQAVLTLLKNFQGSDVFGAAAISSQTPPTQNDPLFRYGLSVPYVQKF